MAAIRINTVTAGPLPISIYVIAYNDEPNMRAYMLALQENKSDVDRIRSICSNPCACGQPDAC